MKILVAIHNDTFMLKWIVDIKLSVITELRHYEALGSNLE